MADGLLRQLPADERAALVSLHTRVEPGFRPFRGGRAVSDPRSLVVLTEGARMLAEARTLDDVRQIKTLALAAQTYARKKGLGLDAP